MIRISLGKVMYVRNYILIIAILLLAGSAGCQRQQAVDGASGGKVEASTAYRTWYGEPPTVTEGTAWAFAGFFPLAEDPGKVMPVPLFLFTAQNQPQLLLGKVLQGGAYLGLPQLAADVIPPGAAVRAVTVKDGEAVVDFSNELLQVTDPLRQQGILAAIGHTLVQFPDIERVRTTVDGQPLPFAPSGTLPIDAAALSDPGPPDILQALLHEDADAVPGEVVVFFNRPVQMKSFRLEYPRGQQAPGQYFTSVFDMAVILHPQTPDLMQVGSEVFIEWQVVDSLGREGSGQTSLILGHLSHD
jgi:hypothetical protein